MTFPSVTETHVRIYVRTHVRTHCRELVASCLALMRSAIIILVECLALWASGSGPEALFEPALLLVETDTYTSCSSYICEMPVLDAIQCMTFKPFL